MDETRIHRVEQFRDRWTAFGTGVGILGLSEKLSAAELRQFDVFASYDDNFLEIISPDVSVAQWSAGAVLFEAGSYLDLAFCLVSGQVGVYVPTVAPGQAPAAPIFQGPPTIAATGSTLSMPDLSAPPTAEVPLLATMDFDIRGVTEMRLGPGEVFGEIGALSGWPQSVTAKTLTACTVVQIRLPALRRMRVSSPAFKARMDTLYRERSLLPQLQACPLFRGCPDELLIDLGRRASLVSCEPGEVVVEEGAQTDAFYLVRSGFIGLTQQVGTGRAVVNYLSKGMTFGEVELLLDDVRQSRSTATSVGYAELVCLTREAVLEIVRQQPAVEARLWASAVARIKEAGFARANPPHSEFLEFTLSEGLVEGNSVLVIDLDTCTRCDDCVRACADTHGGRPRFVREGDKRGNLLIARSCFHCQDPVCLVGCPTGAIRRANVGDVVEIKEPICIGCGTCANNCPYDAIVMHDTKTLWPANALPKSLRETPRAVASKCDLCHTSPAGPACVRSCPHDSAFRISSVDEFRRLQRGSV